LTTGFTPDVREAINWHRTLERRKPQTVGQIAVVAAPLSVSDYALVVGGSQSAAQSLVADLLRLHSTKVRRSLSPVA
jgi:hypothetical protein